jgi:hypothetical protein
MWRCSRNQSLVMIILRQCQLLLQLCQQCTFSWPVAGEARAAHAAKPPLSEALQLALEFWHAARSRLVAVEPVNWAKSGSMLYFCWLVRESLVMPTECQLFHRGCAWKCRRISIAACAAHLAVEHKHRFDRSREPWLPAEVKITAEKERIRALQRQKTGWWLIMRLQMAAGRSPCEMVEMLPRYNRQETSPVFSGACFQANHGALECETVIYLPLFSLSESRGIPYCLAKGLVQASFIKETSLAEVLTTLFCARLLPPRAPITITTTTTTTTWPPLPTHHQGQ